MPEPNDEDVRRDQVSVAEVAATDPDPHRKIQMRRLQDPEDDNGG